MRGIEGIGNANKRSTSTTHSNMCMYCACYAGPRQRRYSIFNKVHTKFRTAHQPHRANKTRQTGRRPANGNKPHQKWWKETKRERRIGSASRVVVSSLTVSESERPEDALTGDVFLYFSFSSSFLQLAYTTGNPFFFERAQTRLARERIPEYSILVFGFRFSVFSLSPFSCLLYCFVCFVSFFLFLLFLLCFFSMQLSLFQPHVLPNSPCFMK